MRPNSLEEAFAELGKLGLNEVLVEAGPEIADSILASSLWDELVLIKQSNAPDEADEITLVPNQKRQPKPILESANVFGNH